MNAKEYMRKELLKVEAIYIICEIETCFMNAKKQARKHSTKTYAHTDTSSRLSTKSSGIWSSGVVIRVVNKTAGSKRDIFLLVNSELKSVFYFR